MSYAKLPAAEKKAYAKRLVLRRKLFEQNVLHFSRARGCTVPEAIVLVGDRPGPAAPKDPSYHHTPFYSTKNSSSWLNCQLLREEIPEERLLWINAYDKDGVPNDPTTLLNLRPDTIIALGGNAAKWLEGVCGLEAGQFVETYHPQYWKRFRSGERYPLLDILKGLAL